MHPDISLTLFHPASTLAKKLKADLIEKAKIKKRYFKELNEKANSHSDSQASNLFHVRDEGRFAPEDGAEGKDGLGMVEAEIGSQKRRRRKEEEGENGSGRKKMSKSEQNKAELVRVAESESKRRLQGGIMHFDSDEKDREISESKPKYKSKDAETSEQKKEQRQKKQEKWNSRSGSRAGRQRGQPNLGARMDLLLDRIKQG